MAGNLFKKKKKISTAVSVSAKKTKKLHSELEGEHHVIPSNGQTHGKETVDHFPAQAETQCSLDSTSVKEGVNALLQLLTKEQEPTLFTDDAEPIFLQITSIRIPKTPQRQIRLPLPHSLVNDTSEVCLFVTDLKKGKKVDHEPTVEHYKTLLENNNITGISQVIPMRQLKVEYDQYELKQRLCNQFDFFLTDGRVAGHVRHMLGKTFHSKRKYPTPIRMTSNDLKNRINKALSKTVLNLHGNGNSFVLTVAQSKHTADQIKDNIIAVAQGLAKHFPGGWNNIRSLYLKAGKSMPLPVYMTLKSSNLVDIPVVKPKRPKAAIPVEGELSTMLGARVTVLPSGDVIVHKVKADEEDSDEDLNEYLKEEEAEKAMKRSKKQKQKKSRRRIPVESNSENSSVSDIGEIVMDTNDDDKIDENIHTQSRLQKDEDKSIKKNNKTTSETTSKKQRKNKKSATLVGDSDDDAGMEAEEMAYLSEWHREQEAAADEKKSKNHSVEDASPQKTKKQQVFEDVQNIKKKKKKLLNKSVSNATTNLSPIENNNNNDDSLNESATSTTNPSPIKKKKKRFDESISNITTNSSTIEKKKKNSLNESVATPTTNPSLIKKKKKHLDESVSNITANSSPIEKKRKKNSLNESVATPTTNSSPGKKNKKKSFNEWNTSLTQKTSSKKKKRESIEVNQ